MRSGVHDYEGLKRTFEYQATNRRLCRVEPCFECKEIAIKLGMEV